MWAKLEYVDVWYTPPVEDPERRSSQRWHRDFNDRHLLKAFLYLGDVDEESGPFEYVPRTAPGSELEHLWPWRPLGDNYPPEEELDAKVADRAVRFTAPKGTLIFCNTSGFHRGGFATQQAARPGNGDVLVAGLACVADGAKLQAADGRHRRAGPGAALLTRLS